MADEVVELTFTKERETKNTVVYQEQPVEDRPMLIGALYIQKWWAKGTSQIRVTLTR